MTRRLVVGVIGHVDHGKTALVRAITGIETDRLEEERRRGISIALGFAHFEAAGATIDLIDMPGHERFLRTMVAGASGIDGVLLVVDAGEGIKPQTLEHLEIASLLGLRRTVVAISKSDRASPEAVARLGREIGVLLDQRGMTALAVIGCSALTGVGIAELAQALGMMAADAASVPGDGFAWLPIDRAFSIAGHGTVVTGTLRHGALSNGDEMALLPGGERVRLRSLQVHGARRARAEAGQRVAANLRDVAAGALSRGMALATPGALGSAHWITLAVEVARSAPRGVRNGDRLVLLWGTAETAARLRLLDADSIEPGGQGLAQLHCATPVMLPARLRVVLRQASPAATLAGGRVIDPEARRERRREPAMLARLTRLASETPAQIVRSAVEAAGLTGLSLVDAARRAGLGPAEAAAALQDAPVVLLSGVAVSQVALTRAAGLVGGAISRAGETGIARESLAASLPGIGAAVLAEAAAQLMQRGKIRLRAGKLAAVSVERDRVQACEDGALADRVVMLLRGRGLAPPDRAELTRADQRLAPLLNRLVSAGALIQATDQVQKRDFLFHPDAIDLAKRTLAPLLADGASLLTGEAGRALGITRKHAVPLLEHLDAVRFTRRVADRRTLA